MLTLVASVAACSSPSEPRGPKAPIMPPLLPSATLFVTNPTCAAGVCQHQQVDVYAFAWEPLFDNTTIPLAINGGFGGPNYGSFTGPNACLRFPPAYTAWLISNGDTLSFTWRPDDPDGVYLQVAAGEMGATTRTFVPGDAPGWDVSIVADTTVDGVHYTAQVSADTACVSSS